VNSLRFIKTAKTLNNSRKDKGNTLKLWNNSYNSLRRKRNKRKNLKKSIVYELSLLFEEFGYNQINPIFTSISMF
jgi:hypothetical protein